MRFHQPWRRVAALLLCSTVFASGCASTQGVRLDPLVSVAGGHPAIAEFIQQLPLGTTVRIDRVQGPSIRGTLLKASAEMVTIQAATRIPEPPVDLRVAEIVRVQPETANGRSLGKAIGAGAAAGAGAALGVFLLLLAIFSD